MIWSGGLEIILTNETFPVIRLHIATPGHSRSLNKKNLYLSEWRKSGSSSLTALALRFGLDKASPLRP